MRSRGGPHPLDRVSSQLRWNPVHDSSGFVCWLSSSPSVSVRLLRRPVIERRVGPAACQKGYRVRFTTAAALVNELLEARDDKRLLRFQKQLAKQDLLIVDELGYVPLSKTGAELLFEIFSQRYE